MQIRCSADGSTAASFRLPLPLATTDCGRVARPPLSFRHDSCCSRTLARSCLRRVRLLAASFSSPYEEAHACKHALGRLGSAHSRWFRVHANMERNKFHTLIMLNMYIDLFLHT